MDNEHTDAASRRRLAGKLPRLAPPHERRSFVWPEVLLVVALSAGLLVGVWGTDGAVRPETGAPLQAVPPSTLVALSCTGVET